MKDQSLFLQEDNLGRDLHRMERMRQRIQVRKINSISFYCSKLLTIARLSLYFHNFNPLQERKRVSRPIGGLSIRPSQHPAAPTPPSPQYVPHPPAPSLPPPSYTITSSSATEDYPREPLPYPLPSSIDPAAFLAAREADL